ncbi:MAG: helix-turn-helix domain-containing protein [Acidobacteria bacterium]|nr:helix-turn-helix domain-containing protein [Acidobacteriota bacterium]
MGQKLLRIRTLGLSQSGMVQRLGMEMSYRNISKYERDKSPPPLNVLLAYARLAKVSLAPIIDDDLDLVFKVVFQG